METLPVLEAARQRGDKARIQRTLRDRYNKAVRKKSAATDIVTATSSQQSNQYNNIASRAVDSTVAARNDDRIRHMAPRVFEPPATACAILRLDSVTLLSTSSPALVYMVRGSAY